MGWFLFDKHQECIRQTWQINLVNGHKSLVISQQFYVAPINELDLISNSTREWDHSNIFPLFVLDWANVNKIFPLPFPFNHWPDFFALIRTKKHFLFSFSYLRCYSYLIYSNVWGGLRVELHLNSQKDFFFFPSLRIVTMWERSSWMPVTMTAAGSAAQVHNELIKRTFYPHNAQW